MSTLLILKNQPKSKGFIPTFLTGLSIGVKLDPNSGARHPTSVHVRSLKTSTTRCDIEIRAKWLPAFECGPTLVKVRFSGRMVKGSPFLSGSNDHAIAVFKDEVGIDRIGTEFRPSSGELIGPMLSKEMSRGLMEVLTTRSRPLPHEKVLEVTPIFGTRLAALLFSQDPTFRKAQPNGFVPRLDEDGLIAPTALHEEILPCARVPILKIDIGNTGETSLFIS